MVVLALEDIVRRIALGGYGICIVYKALTQGFNLSNTALKQKVLGNSH
jgi:hypothetical protein